MVFLLHSGTSSHTRNAHAPSPHTLNTRTHNTHARKKHAQVYDARDEEERGFGLLGDDDHLWTRDDREQQRHQVKRAKRFLDILWANAPEKVRARICACWALVLGVLGVCYGPVKSAGRGGLLLL